MSSTQHKLKNQTLIQYLVPASKQSNSPLQNVREIVEEYRFLTNWKEIEYDGWKLPATEEKHCWCGIWQTFGCLNEELHDKLGKGRRVYIKQYQRSCYRASCEECYSKWIARQANVATRRIEKYEHKTKNKPKHIVLSIHPSQYDLPYNIIRNRMKQILKIAQFSGGVIFHPFRLDKKSGNFYYAPHFHVVGFGYRFLIAKSFGKFRWYIKICDDRESVFQTFCYLLSHCGIKKRHHAMAWIGSLSYSKLKVEKEPKIICCPICGGNFEEVYYYEVFHPVVPPDKFYEGLVDAEGWYPVFSEPVLEISEYRFDYAPTIDLNETLKGLSMAN